MEDEEKEGSWGGGGKNPGGYFFGPTRYFRFRFVSSIETFTMLRLLPSEVSFFRYIVKFE